MAISRDVFMEWYFLRVNALEEEARGLREEVRGSRKAQPAACERLRALEVERRVLAKVYEDLRGFILE